MTLADTSAWIEFLRDDGTIADRVEELTLGSQLLCTEPVVMEILAGARSQREFMTLRAMLSDLPMVHVGHLGAWDSAAAVYRACRSAGATPRSQIDCLIAAVAIREDVEVLHSDRDFDAIAKHTPLRVAAL